MSPVFDDGVVAVYHCDAMELLPRLGQADAIITDPPYGETSLEWDRWPVGWPFAVEDVARQLWCFGSMRMFLDRRSEFVGWKFGQDLIWEKHNGSSSAADRFRRVHECALHFYRGEWGALYREVPTTNDAIQRTVRRKRRPPHWGDIGEGHYVSQDGGPRLMTSVIYARGCHGFADNETQKPEAIVAPLIQYSVPPGGLVIDPFAGSGTTGVVARKLGRRAVLIEKREDQIEAILRRIGQGSLLGVAA